LPATPLELDLAPYAGTYERLSVRIELAPEDGRLVGTTTLSGPIAEMLPDPVQKVVMTPVDAATFLASDPDDNDSTPGPAVFYDFVGGVPRYLHFGARTHPRVST
jgi:hypothetical protein